MTPLQAILTERIQREGPITFADYMRMALYEPGYGYYVTGAAKMGWEGDYYTSTDVSAFFAHCMGRQLVQFWEQLKRPVPFVVIEQGAGRGDLGHGIRLWAQQEQPAFYEALQYQSEDINIGVDVIAGTLPTSGDDANDSFTTFPSVMLSNELVDAFPVHVIEVYNQQLYEVYVDLHHGRLHEVLDKPSTPALETYLEAYSVPWRTFENGWRAEIHLDALHWMRNTAQRLQGIGTRKRRGYLLAIDYGDKARKLYSPYRQHGTLASYFQHQFTERPLAHPGEQDITAHVNFSALITEGRKHGLRLHTFTTQREWLEQMGIYEELEQTRIRDFALADNARASDKGQVALLQWYNLRQRVSTLTDRSGMGNFKVLVMKR